MPRQRYAPTALCPDSVMPRQRYAFPALCLGTKYLVPSTWYQVLGLSLSVYPYPFILILVSLSLYPYPCILILLSLSFWSNSPNNRTCDFLKPTGFNNSHVRFWFPQECIPRQYAYIWAYCLAYCLWSTAKTQKQKNSKNRFCSESGRHGSYGHLSTWAKSAIAARIQCPIPNLIYNKKMICLPIAY